MNGYMLIDKPADWTSFDVVAKLRSLACRQAGHKVKVGHAGTLDPFATGLLIVLFGSYTKRQDEFMKMDKSYDVTAVLGQTSTTGDPEGELDRVSVSQPTQGEVNDAIALFQGVVQQTPPAHSAIKVNGKRAYDLARQGKEVALQPRNVRIHISRAKYAYPEIRFSADVSSGTYIRSLVADIGLALGVGAFTKQLRRTAIGGHLIQDANSLDGVADRGVAALLRTVD